MRKARKNTATRQVIHIVGEGLTELFYFSHLKKILGYRYSISPRLFENNSIEKIEKKIKELLDEDVFVICVFDADVSRRSDSENKKMVSLKKKYENNPNVILCDSLEKSMLHLSSYNSKTRYYALGWRNLVMMVEGISDNLTDADRMGKYIL